MSYLGIFRLEFEKRYCHIRNHGPWICLIAKFSAKIKILKFGTKNSWFWYYWARNLKNYWHIWNQLPQICLNAKFCEKKQKMPKFGIKNALFGYFWAEILNNYCHIWNQDPQICQKWVFNSYSKFWYRVRFF